MATISQIHNEAKHLSDEAVIEMVERLAGEIQHTGFDDYGVANANGKVNTSGDALLFVAENGDIEVYRRERVYRLDDYPDRGEP